MAEDLEVGVLLKPKNNLEEDVGPVSVGAEGDSGGLTTAQRDQQGRSLFRGLRTALLATGIVGLLANLKPITATLGAILGIIGRTLVPIIEEVADLIRPLVQFANEVISSPDQAVAGATQFLETGGGFVQEDENFNKQLLRSLGVDEENIIGSEQTGENTGIIDAIANFFNDPSRTADQTGEQSKQKLKNDVEDARSDKTGAFFP